MIFLASMLIGAAAGAMTARRRGGNGFDMAQYGAVWGLIGLIAGLALTVAVDRVI